MNVLAAIYASNHALSTALTCCPERAAFNIGIGRYRMAPVVII
jgi:hypothetical protein